jgi:hypothetical protein
MPGQGQHPGSLSCAQFTIQVGEKQPICNALLSLPGTQALRLPTWLSATLRTTSAKLLYEGDPCANRHLCPSSLKTGVSRVHSVSVLHTPAQNDPGRCSQVMAPPLFSASPYHSLHLQLQRSLSMVLVTFQCSNSPDRPNVPCPFHRTMLLELSSLLARPSQ